MNLTELAHKVAHVRRLQQSYFKTRDSTTLSHCKKAERELDDIIARLLPLPTNKDQQLQMDIWSG